MRKSKRNIFAALALKHPKKVKDGDELLLKIFDLINRQMGSKHVRCSKKKSNLLDHFYVEEEMLSKHFTSENIDENISILIKRNLLDRRIHQEEGKEDGQKRLHLTCKGYKKGQQLRRMCLIFAAAQPPEAKQHVHA